VRRTQREHGHGRTSPISHTDVVVNAIPCRDYHNVNEGSRAKLISMSNATGRLVCNVSYTPGWQTAAASRQYYCGTEESCDMDCVMRSCHCYAVTNTPSMCYHEVMSKQHERVCVLAWLISPTLCVCLSDYQCLATNCLSFCHAERSSLLTLTSVKYHY